MFEAAGPAPLPADPPSPRPAATVVLLRSGRAGLEVLLTRRPASMAFAADLFVFPGGAVDPGDLTAGVGTTVATSPAVAVARLGGGIGPADALGFHVAAVRELFEEAGVLLAEPAAGAADAIRARLTDGETGFAAAVAELGLVLRTDRLWPLGHWVTPPFMARRFDTRFFAAELPPEAEARFEDGEVAEHRWLRPLDALASMAAGELAMLPPTAFTLAQLAWIGGVGELAALAPSPAGPPALERIGRGLARLALTGAGGIPGRPGSGWLAGERELVIIDPGDPGPVAAELVMAEVARRRGRLAGVILTSADPDRAAGAEGFSLGLGIPIFGAAGAGRWLVSPVTELADGERVPVGDLALTLLAAPGPRPDQAAYLLEDDDGAIDGFVGDLAGPARVGPGPAPDPAAWAASLDRLAAVRPRRVLPARGPALDPAALGPDRVG